MKHFDIYFNGFRKESAQTTEEKKEILDQIKRLAQDNADLIGRGIVPVIISRHATEDEVAFYKEFATMNDFEVSAKQLKRTVFNRFVDETKIIDQEDSHLMSREMIKEKLQVGLNAIQENNASEMLFEEASEMIASKVRERKEMQNAKFRPVSCFTSFVLWILFAVVFFVMKGFNFDTIFAVSVAFVGLMGFSIIGDYVLHQKRLHEYFSPEGEKAFWESLEKNNAKKNAAIHRVENMIDTLYARNCLTVLSVGKRREDVIEDLLEHIDEMPLSDIIRAIL